LYQLLIGQQSVRGTSQIRFGSAQLDGLSALVTHGFRPARLDMYTHGGVFYAAASHPLPMGRWLNVQMVVTKGSKGFPNSNVRIGSLPFSPILSRMLFEVGRWILQSRGADLPSLDSLVQDFSIEKNDIIATISLPEQGIFLDEIAGYANRVNTDLVVQYYCRLVKDQVLNPQSDFSVQIRRAFPASGVSNASPDANRAAFVALAMIAVDKSVGKLAKLSQAQLAECPENPLPITLLGRMDSPKHLALSAALAATTGIQLAEAMGEWKELADSLTDKADFHGDSTGFSFVDIAADRSGFRIARAAVSVGQARAMAQRLSIATESELLPPELLNYSDGMKDPDFVKAYGGIDDQRYVKVINSIDAVLNRHGLVEP
jgi:hypothetical protein